MTKEVGPSGHRPGLVIVLAAGGGTRMKSQLPKVLHEILGRPLLGHVLRSAYGTAPTLVSVVVGHHRELVKEYLNHAWPDASIAVQAEQNGTGHAVRCALEQVVADAGIPDGPIAVIAGDTPLLTSETLAELVNAHVKNESAVTVLSSEVADPTGYGRIVRDADGGVVAIVEQKDAQPDQVAIREINSGMYVFSPDVLIRALADVTSDNSQGEEYLTDVLGLARSYGERVDAFITSDSDEVHGINDRVQLAEVAALLRDRVNEAHMRSGVTFVDPKTAWVGVDASLGQDTVVERNTSISDRSSVGERAIIGPDTTLLKAAVGNGARVVRSHVDSAKIGPGASVGPFTFLRPGTILAKDAKVGAYVEVKKSTVGPGSKVPHLTYVGDATIGSHANIGAATIFANYDGEAKHPIVVGDHVRIGSDTILVAPVNIGNGAYTAAGSVITDDVPPGAIGIGRGKQRNIIDWVKRRRPGTASAHAAAASAQAAAADSAVEDSTDATPDPAS